MARVACGLAAAVLLAALMATAQTLAVPNFLTFVQSFAADLTIIAVIVVVVVLFIKAVGGLFPWES